MSERFGPGKSFIEARAAHDSLTAETQEFVDKFRADFCHLDEEFQVAARYLDNWQSVVIINSGERFPMEMSAGKKPLTIDAQRWPEVRKLCPRLIAWHKSKAALEAASENVPEGRRAAFNLPPLGAK